LNDRDRDYLDRMQVAAGRMQRFIDDLLQYSKVTLKAQPFELTDLGQVVAETLGDIEARLSQTGGRVEFSGLPLLDADRFQMRQLFQNLISNSLKFHREGVPPIVKIHARREENGFWKIIVEDNGVGFDAKFADRIFKPFERLHGRTRFEGSGMGLAICRKIVDRHKGDIHAESEPNRGAKFVITFPEKQG
jgi:signal transduction histidine kinase